MISIGNLQINKLCLGDVEVTKAYLGDVEVYGSKPKPEGKYMTMTVLDGDTGTTISPKITGTLSPNLQYRINSNGDWNDFIVGTTADIQVVSGDWVQFKGVNESGISVDYNNYLTFAISGNSVALSGNLMSLIDGVGDALVIPNKDCFCFLFENSNVKTVSKDFLPATTLKNNCYERMFWKCTSLTTAPELPATTLAEGCYIFMFYGCTSLVKAPELPATTLKSLCYQSMFSGCTSLNYVKCLATSGTINNGSVPMSLYNWLYNVAATGTFVKPAGVEYVLNSNGGIPSGWTVEEIDVPTPPEPEGKYMTITVDDSAGETTIKPTVKGSLPNLNLQYRVNGGDWADFIVGTTADIKIGAGDVLQFKGDNKEGVSNAEYHLNIEKNYLNFVVSGNPVHLSGNIMSLIDGVGDALEIPRDYCFYALFRNSVIKTVSSDFLPATTLTPYCYQGMFQNCTALEIAPELPATIVKKYCYSSMFDGCTSLVTAPVLPATTLASNCYAGMFHSCTSLVTAHEFPATTLAESCYSWMFSDCTSLKTAPELHATVLDQYCYEYMFNGCTGLVNAPELPATTLTPFCYYNMFSDCTSLEIAPVLPATTLVDSCYLQMFEMCRKLNYVKSMATEGTIKDGKTVPSALQNWLNGVASTGTFVKPAAAVYVTDSIGGIPKGWTVQNI